MLVEALITLVNARGIDLRHVAGNSSNTEGIARRRRLSQAEMKLRRELKVALEVNDTAKGASSRVSRPPMWAHPELAQALYGVPRMPELALYYSLAGWLGGFEELQRGLMLKQLHTAEREKDWPMIVGYIGGRASEPYDYIPRLATLVLIADAEKQNLIAAGPLFALMGMEEAVWQQTLAARFLDLQQQYERWYLMALKQAQKRLRAHEESAPAYA